jgi:broad specificity phosphatase PhoE
MSSVATIVNSSSSSSNNNNTSRMNTPPSVLLSNVLPPLAPTNKRVYLIRHGETEWNAMGKIQGSKYDIPLNSNGIHQAHMVAKTLCDIDLSIIASSNLSRAVETANILYNQQQHQHQSHTTSSNNTNTGMAGTTKNNNNNDDDIDHYDNDGAAAGIDPIAAVAENTIPTTTTTNNQSSSSSSSSSSRRITRIIDSGLNEMSFGSFEGLAYRDVNVDPTIVEDFKRISKQVKDDPTVVYPGGGESTEQVQKRAMNVITTILTMVREDDSANHIAIVSHGRTNKVLIATTTLLDVKRVRDVQQSNTAINVLDVSMVTGEWTAQIINYIDHVKGHVIER